MTAAPTRAGQPDPAAGFLEDLSSQGHIPLLHHASGTLRVDLVDGGGVERWYITVANGNISLSHRNAKADAVLRTERKLFVGMVKGNVNVSAALLRGVVEIEGDLGLLTSFARLFPGPAASRASFLERQKEIAR